MSTTDTTQLATGLQGIPGRYAQPDPSTLATLPKGGAQLSYMGHAEVTLALIDVDPLWNWRPMALDVDSGGPAIEVHPKRLVMWGYLTVLGVERLCVGTCEPGKGDPEKELVGDLLRNGAMRFGIGTKLWSKATDADPAGSAQGGFNRGGRTPPPPPRNLGTGGISEAQSKRLFATLSALGIKDRDACLAAVNAQLPGRAEPITSSKQLSKTEAAKVIDALEALPVPA